MKNFTGFLKNLSGQYFLFILLGATLVYLPSLAGPFQFDDYVSIVDNSSVHTFRNWLSSLESSLRPLLNLTYAINWLFDSSPPGFHFVNIAVHLLNIALVAILAECMFSNSTIPRAKIRISRTSLIIAALFALHPVQTEAITYISARSSALSAAICFLALLFHIRGIRSGARVFNRIVSPLFFLLAMLVKETAVFFPLALVIWDVLIEKRNASEVLKSQSVWLIMGVVLLAGAIMHPSYYRIFYNQLGYRPLGESAVLHVIVIVRLMRSIIPGAPLSIDPGFGLLNPGPTELFFASGLLLLFVSVLLFASRFHRVTVVGLLWFFGFLLIPYLFISRYDVLNERHLYMPMLGLLTAVAPPLKALRDRIYLKPAAENAVIVLTIVLMAFFTVERNYEYRTEIALWSATVKASPENPRAHNNLGYAYELAGDERAALKCYTRALHLLGDYPKAKENLLRVRKRLSCKSCPDNRRR